MSMTCSLGDSCTFFIHAFLIVVESLSSVIQKYQLALFDRIHVSKINLWQRNP